MVALIDTNILVYAYDRSESSKQQRALEVLQRVALNNSGVLSTQVLGELFVVLTRKLPEKFSLGVAKQRVENYLRSWKVLPITPFVIQEAIRGSVEYKMSYFDAQIWAVAKLNQITLILSEDFSDGGDLEGVRFLNPLAKEFNINQI